MPIWMWLQISNVCYLHASGALVTRAKHGGKHFNLLIVNGHMRVLGFYPSPEGLSHDLSRIDVSIARQIEAGT